VQCLVFWPVCDSLDKVGRGGRVTRSCARIREGPFWGFYAVGGRDGCRMSNLWCITPPMKNTSKQAGPPVDEKSAPVWLPINEAVRLFGLSRSSLYLLMKEDKIRSSQVCIRGVGRGKPLISFASLKAYVEVRCNSLEKHASPYGGVHHTACACSGFGTGQN